MFEWGFRLVKMLFYGVFILLAKEAAFSGVVAVILVQSLYATIFHYSEPAAPPQCID